MQNLLPNYSVDFALEMSSLIEWPITAPNNATIKAIYVESKRLKYWRTFPEMKNAVQKAVVRPINQSVIFFIGKIKADNLGLFSIGCPRAG
jgi:hypothetical protein